MKLIYCIRALYNPGGMERVLVNKVTWLVRELGWEVLVVTTDQKGRPTFYPFPKEVRMVDLGINYSDDNDFSPCRKIVGYLRRRRRHRRALTRLLQRERADVVVSLFPSESSFIPSIQDGSKKVLELHYCKFFRLQYGRTGLLRMIDWWRTFSDEYLVRRFDKFVVLTHEDCGYWGNLSNLEVIPNAARNVSGQFSDVSSRRVIAVGRLDYQKGFDRLIRAWSLVQADGRFADWRLDLFGQGEWRDMLAGMVKELGLTGSVSINAPVKEIGAEYVASSLLVMSSHYEGFPMVMIEAMACGLPVVSFDYKCGPRDIIRHGENGLLVKDGDVRGLAQAMMDVMGDEARRRQMSQEARKVVSTYSEEVVMRQWERLFSALSQA